MTKKKVTKKKVKPPKPSEPKPSFAHIHDCKFIGNEWNGDVVKLLHKTADGLLDIIRLLKDIPISPSMQTAISITQPKDANSVLNDCHIFGAKTAVELKK